MEEEIITVAIDTDEWYPVFTIKPKDVYSKVREMSKKDLKYVQRATKMFKKAQEILAEIVGHR
jgi:hypothetical protein